MYGLAHTLKVHLFTAHVLLVYGLAHTLKEHLLTLYVLLVYSLAHYSDSIHRCVQSLV